jgi:SpoVK/Ycf46/Vps4 family AAA+-type ATPase
MLVGEYIGQTAPKTKKVIDDSRGGILFIDEAYSLARKGEVDSKDFGREVIEVLLKEMSDPNCDFAVVVAGYPEEMHAFLESNPGLKSRFNYYFEFDDYTPKELMQIAEYSAKKRNIQLSKEAEELFYEELVDAYRKRTKTFGNARLVNSWIDESKMNMGLRLMQHPDLQNLTPEELSTIQKVDVEKIFEKQEKEYVDIPIDEELLAESLNAVNKLVGMENVKQDINELVKLIRFYRETGKNVRNLSLHTVFTGNPGTGKTTVARLLADIFKALGILERGHLVEVTRKDLVAGYIGQTAILTNEQINKAMGGVLFIDEAYSLTSSGYGGDFGKEAVETILKRMEDDRGKFIIIAAGYTQNMKEFLQANPGLSSRFDRTFHFEDSKPDALLTIAENLLKEEKLELDSAAKLHLKTYLENAYKYRDKNFGNARMVRKIIEKTIKNQHLRLANLPAEERKPEIMNIVTLKDVEEFKMDESIKGNRIGFMV